MASGTQPQAPAQSSHFCVESNMSQTRNQILLHPCCRLSSTLRFSVRQSTSRLFADRPQVIQCESTTNWRSLSETAGCRGLSRWFPVHAETLEMFFEWSRLRAVDPAVSDEPVADALSPLTAAADTTANRFLLRADTRTGFPQSMLWNVP